jgi:hypothetical protein
MRNCKNKELINQIHRTWIALLLEHDYYELAAIAVDCSIIFHGEYILNRGYVCDVMIVEIPVSMYAYIASSQDNQSIIESTMLSVTCGIASSQFRVKQPSFIYRVKLVDVEEGWQNIIKNLIANANNPNQATITEKVFFRENKTPILYNEMKFGSQSEVRIAQELEARKVLFFPLPLAVKAETNVVYKDHREPDFLICDGEKWGILEVAFHLDRYEKDSEKSTWFEKSGLYVKYFTAERCFREPDRVVEEFLDILSRH